MIKNYLKSFLLLITTAVLTSNANAVCTITGLVNVCENQTTAYTVSPTGNSYVWNATGGGTIIGSGPTISVAWSGVGGGTVTVAVKDVFNNIICTGTYNVTIHAKPNPVITPSFIAGCGGRAGNRKDDPSCLVACDSTTIKYSTPFHAGSTYLWTVNGSAIWSSSSNVVTVYWTGVGAGSVKVLETNAWGCTREVEICIEIVGKPKSKFTTLPSPTGLVVNVCKNQIVQFINQSTPGVGSPIASFSWYFGDGGSAFLPGPSWGNTSYAYSTAGTYTVMLIVENECHCKDTSYATIVVANSVGPEIYCISTVCPGTTVKYLTNAQNCGTYAWSVTNGTIIGPSNDSVLTVQWGSVGPGSITLGVNCPGFCNAPTTVFVPIISPNATLTGSSLVCLNQCYTYHLSCDIPIDSIKWTFPTGATVLSDSINVHTVQVCYYNSIVIGAVTAIYYHNTPGAIPSLSCGGQSFKNITVRPKIFLFGTNTICVNQTFTVNINPAPTNIYWTIHNSSNTLIASSTIAGNFPYTGIWTYGPGNFVITANDLAGQYCNNPQKFNIKVNPLPPPLDSIKGALFVCPNNAYMYTAFTSGGNYNVGWQVTNGTPTSGIGSIISVVWGPTGPYTLTAVQIDAVTGCKSTAILISASSLLPMAASTFIGNNAPCANSNVNYSTTSQGTLFEWSINPSIAGSVNTGQYSTNISVQWNNYSGAAWVVLKRTVCGVSRKDSISITVGMPPTPTISAPATICQGIGATISSSGAVSFAWNFGDGFTGTGSPITHIYNTPGNFIITLTTTYGGSCPGSSTVTKPISVNPKPNVTISSPNPNVYCAAPINTTMYVAAPAIGTTYQWFNPGLVGTGTSYNTTTSGSYFAVGTNTFGCKDTSNIISTSIINCTPCKPATPYSINFTRRRIGCSKDSFIAAVSAGIINLTWNFDDPFNPGGATGSNTSHIFTEPGYYRVKLCADVPNAAGTGYCNICIFKVDTIKFIPNFYDSAYCQSNSDSVKVKFVNTTKLLSGYPAPSWSWLIMPGGFTSSIKNPVKNLAAGTYTVTLTVGGVCAISKTIVISALPNAKFTVVDSICVGQPVLFNNTSTGSSLSSSWAFGDGATSLITNPIRSYSNAGLYTAILTIVNPLGCTDTAMRRLRVLRNTLTASILSAGPTRYCEGDSVKLNLTTTGGYPAYNYLWSNVATTQNIWVKQTGTYYADVRDSKGCFARSNSINILVKSRPKPTIIGPKDACLYSQYQYFPYYPNVSGTLFSWSVDGIFAGSGPSLFYYAATLGTHTIIVNIQSADTCYGADTLNIVVHGLPNITIVSNPVLCAGTNNLLVATSTSTNLAYLYWSTGSMNDSIYVGIPQNYTVTVVDTFGCTASYTKTVNPLPDLCGLMIGCYDICDTVTNLVWFAPPGYAAYQWYYNNVPIAWAVSDTFHIPLYKSGSYKVKITTAFGCSITSKPIDITFVKCGGCKFNLYADILCGPVSPLGNQTYNLTFTINNSLGAGAGISISSPQGIISSISPVILAAGINSVTAVFEDIPPVNNVACFNIVIYKNNQKCDTTICIKLPPCEGTDCKLKGKIKRFNCAGYDVNGNPQYYVCMDVTWGGNNASTLTLSSASGSFIPNPVTINNGTQTLCYTYTDLTPYNTFITIYLYGYDPITGKICKDSIKTEYKPCKDSCELDVYSFCAHCEKELQGGIWSYNIDITVFNPFPGNATVTILPIAAGTFGPISPNPIATGMQQFNVIFTPNNPNTTIICFKVLLTEVSTGKTCWQNICMALPPCDDHTEVIKNTFAAFDVIMYPNPAKDLVTIDYKFADERGLVSFKVYDVNGKHLATFENDIKNKSQVINTSEWQQGVYFINIIKDNKIIGTSKLVIVR